MNTREIVEDNRTKLAAGALALAAGVSIAAGLGQSGDDRPIGRSRPADHRDGTSVPSAHHGPIATGDAVLATTWWPGMLRVGPTSEAVRGDATPTPSGTLTIGSAAPSAATTTSARTDSPAVAANCQHRLNTVVMMVATSCEPSTDPSERHDVSLTPPSRRGELPTVAPPSVSAPLPVVSQNGDTVTVTVSPPTATVPTPSPGKSEPITPGSIVIQ